MSTIHDAAESARRKVYDDALAALTLERDRAAEALADERATVESLRRALAAVATERDAARQDVVERDELIARLRARIAELEAGQQPDPEPPAQPDPGLWYQRPAPSEKVVLAHFFGPFPISTDNADPAQDYYTRNYLRVEGESGKHTAYGGYLRDRPIPRSPLPGDWRMADARTEIQDARAAGIDGFYVNIMGLSGANWDRYTALARAAADFPGFRIVPMIDTNGAVGSATAAQIADAIAYFTQRPGSYVLSDGRHVVGSFKAEGKDPSWWTAIFDQLRTRHGVRAAFVAVFVDIARCEPYFGISYAVGPWGYGSDPGVATGVSTYAARAKAAGVKWQGCALNQNVRYAQGTFDEALGSSAIRATWDRLIREGAELVQVVTWSDFAEGSHIRPSVARGRAPLAITGYYAAKWKAGEFPAVLDDVLILSHRDQPLNARTTVAQTKNLEQKVRTGRTPAADVVEALTYLTAPAQVTVTIGGQTHTYDAPAGEYARTFPLRTGSVSGAVQRGGTTVAEVASPYRVTATPRSQDRQYMFASSLGTEGQYPPINA